MNYKAIMQIGRHYSRKNSYSIAIQAAFLIVMLQEYLFPRSRLKNNSMLQLPVLLAGAPSDEAAIAFALTMAGLVKEKMAHNKEIMTMTLPN